MQTENSGVKLQPENNPAATTVVAVNNLTKKFKVPINKVAVELNQTIVNKKSLGKIKVKKNDKIEIVHFIGGG
mgnify:CR=1 FL=1